MEPASRDGSRPLPSRDVLVVPIMPILAGLSRKPDGAPAAASPLRRLSADQTGATAVEFALVVVPFLALVFAIIETALALWVTAVLENAVNTAARQLYNGTFQHESSTVPVEKRAAKFRDEVCKSIIALVPCAGIKTDVRSLASFPDRPEAFYGTDFGRHETPAPNQVFVVAAKVEFPVFVNLLGLLHSNQASPTGGGKRLILASAAFRSEPYGR